MVKSKYVQFVLDQLCSERKIVKRETLLNAFEKTFRFNNRRTADAALNQVLRRLLRQGVIAKIARGFYYCNTSSTTLLQH
jgi:isoleucyl-tRNA synthetase